MNLKVNHPIAQISTFLWLGFVFAISFMEAWLKFRAPGISVPLGLGIGQLVFGALNIMEWFFAFVIITSLLWTKENLFTKKTLLFLLAVLLLFIQSIWLLPALDVRAVALIHGENLPESHLHFFYIGFEIVKVTALSLFGLKLYKTPTQ